MQLRKIQVTETESSDLRTYRGRYNNLRIELIKLDAMDATQGRYKYGCLCQVKGKPKAGCFNF